MAITPGAKRIIEEKYSTRDQKILQENIYIKDFPLDPPGLFLKTNNFVQQGLNRLLGYYPTDEKWLRVNVGSDGGLLLSRDTATPGMISLAERQAKDVKVMDEVAIPASGLASHVGEDVSGYQNLSVLVSSTGIVTIYLQGSDDNVNWYDLKTTADADVSFSNSIEKIWFKVDAVIHYLRVLIYATNASTVSCVIHGCI